MNFKNFINGKKTYLVALSGLIAVALTWSSGSLSDKDAIENSIALVLAATIRHSVSGLSAEENKNGKK
jgi:hypothetical protein